MAIDFVFGLLIGLPLSGQGVAALLQGDPGTIYRTESYSRGIKPILTSNYRVRSPDRRFLAHSYVGEANIVYVDVLVYRTKKVVRQYMDVTSFAWIDPGHGFAVALAGVYSNSEIVYWDGRRSTKLFAPPQYSALSTELMSIDTRRGYIRALENLSDEENLLKIVGRRNLLIRIPRRSRRR